MLFFYNKKMLGDTLIITIKNSTNTIYEYKKNLTLIKDSNNNLVGLNVFNVKDLEIEHSGNIELTEKQKQLLQSTLENQGIKIDLEENNNDYFIVGEVLTKEKHPDADKLSITTVKIEENNILQIVCGASNVDVGQKVVVATIGAIMPSGLLIKKAKLRGVESNGMLCSRKELGLTPDNTQGILVLDNSIKIGTKLSELKL